jgi:hypothetical protein
LSVTKLQSNQREHKAAALEVNTEDHVINDFSTIVSSPDMFETAFVMKKDTHLGGGADNTKEPGRG